MATRDPAGATGCRCPTWGCPRWVIGVPVSPRVGLWGAGDTVCVTPLGDKPCPCGCVCHRSAVGVRVTTACVTAGLSYCLCPHAGVRVPAGSGGSLRDTLSSQGSPGPLPGPVRPHGCLCPWRCVGVAGCPAAAWESPRDPRSPAVYAARAIFGHPGRTSIFGCPVRGTWGQGRAGVTGRDTRSRGTRWLCPQRGVAQGQGSARGDGVSGGTEVLSGRGRVPPAESPPRGSGTPSCPRPRRAGPGAVSQAPASPAVGRGRTASPGWALAPGTGGDSGDSCGSTGRPR